MKKQVLSVVVAILLLAGVIGISDAALTTIGTATYGGSDYNLIYDADSPFGPITWLDYTHSTNTWQNQMDWAFNLNNSGVITCKLNPGVETGWTGEWRLPAIVDGPQVWGHDGTATIGCNITTSEMGHLYYEELGNIGYFDTNGLYVGDGNWGLKKTGVFENLISYWYWSNTECTHNPNCAWDFGTYDGFQESDGKPFDDNYGIAVRSGQVSAVPVPATIWLLGAGVIGLVSLQKRR